MKLAFALALVVALSFGWVVHEMQDQYIHPKPAYAPAVGYKVQFPNAVVHHNNQEM